MASDPIRAHDGLPFMNPLAEADLDAAIAALELPAGARVLEVGSGRGDVLARIPAAQRIGVDLEAVPPREGLDLRVGDAAAIDETFDLVVCAGSIHAVGGFPAGLRWLAEHGERVLLADGFWRREPADDFLAALGGASRDELGALDDLRAAFALAGLREVFSAITSRDAFDRYEETLLANAQRLGLDAYAERIRTRRALPGGTDTIGFGVFALVRFA